ncbi:MAG: DUF6754 domain-containing protein, partial [Chloroflexota bacterium]
LAIFTLVRRKSLPVFRELAAFKRVRRSAGLAVEEGTRIHVSLGRGGLLTRQGAAGLAGLALLRQLGEQTSTSDRPSLATSGDPVIAALSQDTLETAYQAVGAGELYQATNARLAGLTPFSYAAGTMPTVRGEQISTNILIGDFGPEVALIADAVERENSALVGAASDPAAQAILFAVTPEPMMGEELFAAPAYADGKNPSHRASLQAQDVLRWIVILALLVSPFAAVILGFAK